MTTATIVTAPSTHAIAEAVAPLSAPARKGISLYIYPLLLLALALPFVAGKGGLLAGGAKDGLITNFQFLQLSLMIVYSIAVLGLILLTGFNGQISLGHGAFFAAGAYVAAILIDRYGMHFLLTLPLAAAVCFVLGYLFGKPALRLEGHYLALATFALAVATPQILKYKHFEPFTNGVQGINLIKPDPPFGLKVSADQWMYLIVLVVAVIMFWLARNLLDSRMGRAMRAVRDQPLAADTMGIDRASNKTITFGLSAMYVGVAGALHAIIFEFISPDSFRFEVSIALLVGAVVGGVASLPGAVIGGIFVQVIEKYADKLTKQISHAVHLPIELEPWTIYGIVLIVLMYVMPNGIAGGIAGLMRRVRR